uniref:Uncharacterized protein n=1 Tax=uncultured bacterium contig00078 TaxID=1181556 RepID=A0A806KKN7_9BACT|nr:hypothetical protein [uncultured bacterium contig00078]
MAVITLWHMPPDNWSALKLSLINTHQSGNFLQRGGWRRYLNLFRFWDMDILYSLYNRVQIQNNFFCRRYFYRRRRQRRFWKFNVFYLLQNFFLHI